MNQHKLLIVSFLSLVFLSGCSWLGGKDDDILQPAKLVDFEKTIDITSGYSPLMWAPRHANTGLICSLQAVVMWSLLPITRVRSQRWMLPPVKGCGALIYGFLYLAVSVMGQILFYLGTIEGEVYALSAEDGSLLWTAQLSSEVVASPAANTLR